MPVSIVVEPVERAWAQSFLAELPLAAQKELIANAREEELLTDQNLYRELLAPRFSILALIVSGMVRSYVTAPSGRRIAARYWGSGQIVGLTSVLLHGAPGGVEVVRRGSMLRLDPVTLERLAQTDARVGWVVAKELARRLADGAANRTPHTFGSVRVRVAWHLTKLAIDSGGRRMVRVTQQEMADSVGSVREVVARVLLALCEDGILSREGPLLVVRDPERLDRLAEGYTD